ncbi:MAG: carboxypeptidase-like regulatory domain-containing protein [Gemmatimonadota bacterium]
MIDRSFHAILVSVCVLTASAVEAQVPVVLNGRVEDAASREPVEGARVFSADSSAAVLTDSTGTFAIQLSSTDSLVVQVERIGYLSQRFDLPDEASNRTSVLLLEQAPVELEGVTAVGETAIATVLRNLEVRRNGYPHAMNAFDRAWIDRFGPVGGSIYDLVRTRVPRITPCNSDPGEICVPGRIRTFGNPFPQSRYTVCIDGWKSIAGIDDLKALPVEAAALVEIYKRGSSQGVRVYTSEWILDRARRGRVGVPSLTLGC